jgi:hypothetical protein
MIFEDPIKWRYKVRELWDKKGERYSSELFYVEKAGDKLKEHIVELGVPLERYSETLLQIIESNSDNYSKAKERVQGVKKDLRELAEEI